MKVVLVKLLNKYPPLGMMYLASVLRNNGARVHIIDYRTMHYDEKRFRSEIKALAPDVVGISCLSYCVPPSIEIAKIVKQVSSECHVVMGGPHATGIPEHLLGFKEIDSVVIGEGEHTVVELLDALSDKKDLSSVRGLGFRADGKVHINPSRDPIDNVDEIPYPAYDLVDLDRYYERPDPHGMPPRHKRYMPILSSRGCPFQCTYCHRVFGKRFRPRSAANVIGEMELLYHKYGIREFHIEDDSFNVDMDRAKEILDCIRGKGLKVTIQFPSGLRVDRVDDELARKLRRAGTFMTAVGIESGSSAILKAAKKGLNLDRVGAAVDLLVKQGILVWGYFMIGFPGETRAQMQETITLARRLRLHFASFSIVVPFPGTELFDSVKDRIDISEYFSQRLTPNLPRLQLSQVPMEEMGQVKKRALRRFYTPWRMLRIASNISSLNEVAHYWSRFKKNILHPKFGEALRKSMDSR